MRLPRGVLVASGPLVSVISDTMDPLMRKTPLNLVSVTLPVCLLASVAVRSQPGVAGLDLRVTDADLGPTVTIEEAENRVVEEYRVGSNLYMIKITPVVGAPYYLVDEDGSGDMAFHRGTAGMENNIPQWALLSW